MTEAIKYVVGSLTYSKKSLGWLFFWLLLGDFSASVMTVALAKLLPFHLDSIGISGGGIGWTLSLGPLVSLLLSPFIGVWSDRLRTRWGRRRPFLLLSTPVLAAGLLLIPHIHNYTLLCLVIVVVQVCNVLETVLLYLYADVVPPHMMGRFMAAFRVVSTLGALAFQGLLFPHFDKAPTMVWTVCALVYFVFYQLSLHFVKEGTYQTPAAFSPVNIVKDYAKDGFGSRYIWMLWGALGMVAIASPAGGFVDLFGKKNLGLDMETIARINMYATLPMLVFTFLSGWFLDRVGPRLLWGLFGLLLGLVNVVGFFFVHDANSMLVYYLFGSSCNALLSVALMPMLYAHLPKARFGQLVSTQSVVMQSLIFLSTNCVGQMVSFADGNYRFAIIYSAPFFLLTPVFLFLLHRSKNPFASEEMAMSKSLPVGPIISAH